MWSSVSCFCLYLIDACQKMHQRPTEAFHPESVQVQVEDLKKVGLWCLLAFYLIMNYACSLLWPRNWTIMFVVTFCMITCCLTQHYHDKYVLIPLFLKMGTLKFIGQEEYVNSFMNIQTYCYISTTLQRHLTWTSYKVETYLKKCRLAF